MPEEKLSLTREEQELQLKAGAYAALVKSPAWKHLLDFLAGLADEPLARLRQSSSTDPSVIFQLTLRWRERENILNAVQDEVLGKIEEWRELQQQQNFASGVDSAIKEELSDGRANED